ncbi:threonylcarbamoyl-AMP synthase [Candidatus Desantisbacteria bacterium]|nr:threonylcarbamoyl-AMP synthase [Candidatus Desantisbacteria bacterium]
MFKDFKDFKKNKKKILALINEGKIGIFPTDTVYGIGAKASLHKPCNKIYKIKKRPEDKKIPQVVGSLKDFYKIVNRNALPKIVDKIIQKWLPGPLTIITAISGKDTLALRFPDHDILCDIVKALGEPLALTSANPSGSKSPVKVKDIPDTIINQVDFIIDTGETKYKNESTIIDQEGHILREGVITLKEIKRLMIYLEAESIEVSENNND